MDELIKKLRMYADTYKKEPAGREVEGTVEFVDGIDVHYQGHDADDYIECPFCGYEVAAIDDYCELRPNHCPKCGTKLIY